jgi:hypothetical protein
MVIVRRLCGGTKGSTEAGQASGPTRRLTCCPRVRGRSRVALPAPTGSESLVAGAASAVTWGPARGPGGQNDGEDGR